MNRLRRRLGACALLLALTACGGGLGSGGTGIGSGVGSGGTGYAMGFTLGAITGTDGLVVNGTRFSTSQASFQLEDATSLQPGMTVRVVGEISGDRSQGTATQVVSAADLRGPVAALDAAAGRFSVLGVAVRVDSETIYAGFATLAELNNGANVIVYGLPGAEGTLRATRVERTAETSVAVVSGVVQDLDPVGRTFRVGAATVRYAAAAVQVELANGVAVRVRGGANAQGVLVAAQVQAWSDLPQTQTPNVTLAGMVADFTAPASFRLAGVTVQAGSAVVTGGTLGNGVRVEATGTLTGGVLVATSIRVSPAHTNGPQNDGGTGGGTDNTGTTGNTGTGTGNTGTGTGNTGTGTGTGNTGTGNTGTGTGNTGNGTGNTGNGTGNTGNGTGNNGNGTGNNGNGTGNNGNGTGNTGNGTGNTGGGNGGNGNPQIPVEIPAPPDHAGP